MAGLPASLDPQFDEKGWVPVDGLLSALRFGLVRDALRDLIRVNDKQRFARSSDGRMIRANQVNGAAVDLALLPTNPPYQLDQGTAAPVLAALVPSRFARGAKGETDAGRAIVPFHHYWTAVVCRYA